MIRTQLVMTLTDLRPDVPVRAAVWKVENGEPSPTSWGERRLRLMSCLLDAAQTVLVWRQDDRENADDASRFAGQIVHKGEGDMVTLYDYRADLTFVMTVEPAP